jgi:hypothetical protein
MIDNDASYAYSGIRSIQVLESLNISFYPNPVADNLIINAVDMSSLLLVEIISSSGMTVHRSSSPFKSNRIDLKGINSGSYIVKLKQEDGALVTGRILVVK